MAPAMTLRNADQDQRTSPPVSRTAFGATSSTDISGITVYASQHCLSGNTVFDSSFPGFPGSGLGITTSTFWVCLPCLLELVGIVLFGRAIFSDRYQMNRYI
jgi:hypothetical protein